MAKKLTSHIFIERSEIKHGKKYNYNKIIYRGVDTKVTIICPTHGTFEQTPKHHMSGTGCPSCAIASSRGTNTQFKERAREIHNNKYCYDTAEYTTSKCMVIIGCPKHGHFSQRSDSHLEGHGCIECSKEDIAKALSSNKMEFVTKAQSRHGNRYSYDKVTYINTRTKIKVYDPICHHYFWVTPSDHLQGTGCLYCNSSIGEKKIWDILDTLDVIWDREYRIPKAKHRYRYDFYIPEINLLIEYDEKEHMNNERRLRDKTKDKVAKEYGYRLVRIPETQYDKLDTYIPYHISMYGGKFLYMGVLYSNANALHNATHLYSTFKDYNIHKVYKK